MPAKPAKDEEFTFDNPYNGGANIVVPSSLSWRSKAVMKKLKDDYQKGNGTQVDFEKAEGFLDSFLTRETSNEKTGQRPAFAYCPGLSAKPFWQAEDHELIKQIHDTLKEHEEEIKQEYFKSVDEGEVTAGEIGSGKYFLKPNSWKNIPLGGFGGFNQQAQQTFPKTLAALDKFKERIFSAEFIVMEPDTVLAPHTDATNAYLVTHLGLKVGENCGFQVDNQIHEFQQGDVIFFDQSYAHSAWNKGSDTRVNLLITFFHPEISDEEIQLIKLFVKKIKLQLILFLPLILGQYGLMKLFSKSK